MTEPTQMTPASFLAIVDQIDASIPKLKQFIAQAEANPVLLTIAGKFFPGLATVIPLLTVIGPWLDFLQQLTDAIQAAEGQSGS